MDTKIVFEKKRWLIAITTVIMQLCFGTVHAWSVFKKPLMIEYGWSELSTQAAYMILLAFFGLSSAFVGWIINKKGPRFVTTVGGILFSIGMLVAGIAANIGSIVLLYIGYGFFGGLGACLGYVTPISVLIKWFPDRRGFIAGLAIMGFGAGSFFMGMIAPKLIIVLGVANTLFICSAIFFVLIMVSSQFSDNPPSGWIPDGFILPISRISETSSYTFSEAIKTNQWWLLWGILFLNLTVGVGLISQLSPLAQNIIALNIKGSINIDDLAMKGGLIMAIAMIFNGIGRLFWAWISDLIGRKNTFFAMFITQAILYIYLPVVNDIILFLIIACYLLSCFGGGFATLPAFTADAFGPDNIEKIYGVILTALSVAGIVGPFIFAYFGTYALYISACLLILGLVFTVLFKKPSYYKIQ